MELLRFAQKLEQTPLCGLGNLLVLDLKHEHLHGKAANCAIFFTQFCYWFTVTMQKFPVLSGKAQPNGTAPTYSESNRD